jgi:hypothetical protein
LTLVSALVVGVGNANAYARGRSWRTCVCRHLAWISMRVRRILLLAVPCLRELTMTLSSLKCASSSYHLCGCLSSLQAGRSFSPQFESSSFRQGGKAFSPRLGRTASCRLIVKTASCRLIVRKASCRQLVRKASCRLTVRKSFCRLLVSDPSAMNACSCDLTSWAPVSQPLLLSFLPPVSVSTRFRQGCIGRLELPR